MPSRWPRRRVGRKSEPMTARDWRIARASEIGTSHLDRDQRCQDACGHTLIETKDDGSVLACVVSDGAGSALHSEIGSKLTVKMMLGIIRRHLESGDVLESISPEIVRVWISTMVEVLQQSADRKGRRLRDYACTLLVSIIGRGGAVFFQIGDGAIVTTHGQEDGWSWVFWPQHGEYANTTNFIVSPNAAEVLEYAWAPRRIDEIAMFTDGLENLVLDQQARTAHGPFFETMFPAVRSAPTSGHDEKLSKKLGEYLASPAICDRTDDDKTLLLASRAVRAPA